MGIVPPHLRRAQPRGVHRIPKNASESMSGSPTPASSMRTISWSCTTRIPVRSRSPGFTSLTPPECRIAMFSSAILFIAAESCLSLRADGDDLGRPGHLLSSSPPSRGILPALRPGADPHRHHQLWPQQTDVSEGRTPSGADRFALFREPTPGAPIRVRGRRIDQRHLREYTAHWLRHPMEVSRRPDRSAFRMDDSGVRGWILVLRSRSLGT